MFEFSGSRDRFYPGFQAKEIVMMRVDEITAEGSRMKWLENRSNIERVQRE